MGTAFAKRLLETGYTVLVWNRSAEHTTAAVEAGAESVTTAAELAARSGIVITSLTDAPAIHAALGGPEGALAGDVADTLFIEMSTILPEEQQAIAAEIEAAGAAHVECPVGGTVGPALKGQLLGLGGGADAAWARALPVLEQLCKRVERFGGTGAGAAMKLAVNLPLALYWETLGEARRLVDGWGIDGATFASVLADSSAGPNVLKNRMSVVAETLDGADHPGTFDIAGLRKDLRLALELAARKGFPLPLSESAAIAYDRAVAAGLDGFDGASLSRFVAEN
jgi:3-hydroxyisobutyrate dehydrogenase